MSKTNFIGLNNESSKQTIEKLNILLADYQIFYQNTRGFHWNIKGEKFFELHAKFEDIYNDLHEKIDEIAERILTLGGTPLHTFSDYTENAELKPEKDVSKGSRCMESILESYNTLITKQREIAEMASEGKDEGTTALMSDYIREQEKLVWMLNAWASR